MNEMVLVVRYVLGATEAWTVCMETWLVEECQI